ncbi:MAG: dipeptidyl-peptidase 3 family protein, partial [Bryobacteraceae bacterium]
MKKITLTLAITLLATLAIAAPDNAMQPDQAKLEQMAARFTPTEITVDLSKLAPNDRKVLAKLVEASQIVDGIFLRQMWPGNPSMLLDLANDGTPGGRARLHYFIMNKGPWSALDHNEPFVAGAPPKPEGAGFYPLDATKDEIATWIKGLPAKEQEEAKGFFTVIRRNAANSFKLVPYNT